MNVSTVEQLRIAVKHRHRFYLELRDQPNLDGVPLVSKEVTSDLGETIDLTQRAGGSGLTNGSMFSSAALMRTAGKP